MRVLKARVHSLVDEELSGKFEATLSPEYDKEKPQTVIYTSPYFLRHESGVVAIPPIGSDILIFHDAETNEYFYVSTIVHESNRMTGISDEANKKPLIEKNIYNKKFRPQTMSFKNGKDAGLKIYNQFTDETEPAINQVTVKSTQGHLLSLSDSPIKDCVILRNKDGDGITITANKNASHASNSIDIVSKGNYRCTSFYGEIYMGLVEGRDISIVNNSAGYMAAPLPQYGNVNLVSRWKDINIYTDGVTGNVFISTPLGLIQLRGGTISVYGATVNVNSASDINIKSSAGSINLDAALNINLRAGASLNMTSTATATVAGAAGTNVGLTGTPLELNSPVQISPPRIIPTPPTPNVYGR
jgi:hypothetical protein